MMEFLGSALILVPGEQYMSIDMSHSSDGVRLRVRVTFFLCQLGVYGVVGKWVISEIRVTEIQLATYSNIMRTHIGNFGHIFSVRDRQSNLCGVAYPKLAMSP